jgi:hypothetical protein
MEGETKGSRGAFNLPFFCHLSSTKENLLVPFKKLISATRKSLRFPEFTNIVSKFRGFSQPLRDTGATRPVSGVTLIGKMNREVVGEGKRGRASGVDVGDMRGDRDGGGDDRIVGKKGGEEKTIDTRRPRIGGSRVISNMEEGMGLVRGIIEVEPSFEGRPSVRKGSGRESGDGGRRVADSLDEVEIPAEEGSTVGGGRGHSRNKAGVEGKISTSFKINIKNLEGLSAACGRIPTKLNATPSNRRESNIDT